MTPDVPSIFLNRVIYPIKAHLMTKQSQTRSQALAIAQLKYAAVKNRSTKTNPTEELISKAYKLLDKHERKIYTQTLYSLKTHTNKKEIQKSMQ